MRIFLLMALVLLGCKPPPQQIKELDFGVFRLHVPETWEKIKMEGIDAYVGGIKTSNDTIEFLLGTSLDGLSDYSLLQPYEIKLKLDSMKESYPSSMIFSNNFQLDRDQGIFLREYYYYDTINGYRVKYQIPKKIGRGDFNAYFENIDSVGNDLMIGGQNLDSVNQKLFYESIQTIRFVKSGL